MHVAIVGIMIQDHKEQLPMFVTKLGHYPIVLGSPWLWLRDVAVRFASNTVTVASRYCTTHCDDAPITVKGVTEEPPEPVTPQNKDILEPQIRPQQPFRRNIVVLNGSSFFWTVKKGKLKEFTATFYDIDKAIEAKDPKARPLEEIVLKQYHEFLPPFIMVSSDHLPPHRLGIHPEVRLRAGETPTWGPFLFNVKGQVGSSKGMAEGEYVKKIHPSIVIALRHTSPHWEHIRCRASILY